MKITLSFVLALATTLPLFAQQLDGTFRNENDSIVFSGNNIYFSLRGFAGLHVLQVGEGTFEIENNLIVMQAAEFSGERTTMQLLYGEYPDEIFVLVTSNQNYLVQGVFVETLDARGRTIERHLTCRQGEAVFARADNVQRIRVSMMGYDNITFDYVSGYDFHATIVPHEVVENSTVVFRFNRINDDTLSLLLLSTDFQEGRNRTRALQQLDNRAQRTNRMERRFRKVLPPIDWRF